MSQFLGNFLSTYTGPNRVKAWKFKRERHIQPTVSTKPVHRLLKEILIALVTKFSKTIRLRENTLGARGFFLFAAKHDRGITAQFRRKHRKKKLLAPRVTQGLCLIELQVTHLLHRHHRHLQTPLVTHQN